MNLGNLGGYEILGPIGSGGAGTVFRARAPSGEIVAIKLLHRTDLTASARLARELTLQRALGEGFVPLLASGSSTQGAFIVMPLVEGGTLRDRLKRGPLPVAEAVKLGTTLGTALGRAHDSGIVHRDLKPENILYHSGRPLVADLGLAKLVDSNDQLSKTGDTRGTFGYMPPEQMRDAKHADASADVFALGAVLYECLAGQPAFRGETQLQVVDAVDAGRFTPLRRLRPEVPRAVCAVIERALSADPDDRFEDGEAFAEALARAWRRAAARPRWVLLLVATLLAVGGGFGVAIATSPKPVPAPVVPPPPTKPPPPAAPPQPVTPSRAPRLATIAVLGTSTFRHGAPLTALVARPDRGEVLAGDAQGMLRVWSIPGGEEIDSYEMFRPGEIRSIAALSGGHAIVFGTGEGPGFVQLSPAPLRLTEIPTEGVFAVVGAPRGMRFASVSPSKVQIFDLALRKTLVDVLAPDDGTITACTFRGENQIVIGTSVGSLHAIQIEPPEKEAHIARVPPPVRALAASPSGRFVAIRGGDDSFHFLDGPKRTEIPRVRIHGFALAIPEGQTLISGTKGEAASVDLSRRFAKPFEGELNPIDPKVGLVALGAGAEALRVGSDLVNGNPYILGMERAPGHERLVSAMIPLPNGRLVTAGSDRTVRLWDRATGIELEVHRDHGERITALLPALDGKTIASMAADGDLLVRDAETLAVVSTWSQRTPLLGAARISDGRIVGSTNRGVRELAAAGPGRAVLAGDWKPFMISSLGGDIIATSGNQEVRVHDARTGALVWKRFMGANAGSWCSVARVGEDRVALGLTDGSVHLVELATGKPAWSIPVTLVPNGRISALAVSPDSRWILAGGPPGHDVHIVDASDGRVVGSKTLPASLDFPTCIVFDGDEVLVGTLRGLILRMRLE